MNKKERGFTLIELLVVVLIIGILAGVALPQYNRAVARSRYSTLKSLTKNIADSQELYYLEHGEYADALEKLDIQLPDGQLNTETSTPTRYEYNWGRCQTNSSGNAWCTNNATQMQYKINSQHFGNGKHLCLVLKTKDLTDYRNQICKTETGAETPDPSSYTQSSENYTAWIYVQ